MAQNTTIKSDKFGLYVIAGGYITRPFYGTMFKEGDLVKTHHFGGSTNAGVTFREKEFKFNKTELYEVWCTTGSFQHSVDDPKFAETHEWYKSHSSMKSFFYEKTNREFKDKFGVM
jgi:hypothetical protein